MVAPTTESSTAPPPPTLERGQTIDRFVVVGLVGRGGMGEVYAAYDPDLDRKVALKVLRVRDGSEQGRVRLLREAQATARLSHPNVVVVYDVGTFGNDVFVAMEFVAGGTLQFWIHAAPRSWREVLKVFLPAARGLAAAHAAGLVHRDFKPENAMLTGDGQVRVMDFGLARHVGDKTPEVEKPPAGPEPPRSSPLSRSSRPSSPSPSPPASPSPPPSLSASGAASKPVEICLSGDIDPDATMDLRAGAANALGTGSGNYLALRVSQTGAMVGTPAYMSPEQFASQPTDARTDQFSFCVALYEALYGERPFAGDSYATLMTAVGTNAVRPAPPGSRVPGWLRRVVLRGLETEPARRFPSMDALISALETDPTASRRRAAVAATALACAMGLGLGARHLMGSDAVCGNGADRLANVWELAGAPSLRKQKIRQAFRATGRTYAEATFASASRILDEYVGKWAGVHVAACEATHVRREQSSEVLDLRMGCLEERLTGLRALTDMFTSADGRVVENAVSAVGSLPPLERCSDVPALKALVKPPEDAGTRQRVEALRRQLAQFVALCQGGHCVEAQATRPRLLAEVRAVGYQPLVAEALAAAGRLGDTCGNQAQAAEDTVEAYVVALAAGHDEVAATAAIMLAGESADRLGDPGAGRQWLSFGRAMLARIGERPLLHAWWVNSEGTVLQHEGRSDEAVQAYKEAIEAKERVLGPGSFDAILGGMNLGAALEADRRYPEALSRLRGICEAAMKLIGPEHPHVAIMLADEAEVLLHLDRYAEARAIFQQALEIWTKAGSDSFFRSFGLLGLGFSLLGEGNTAAALPPLGEAVDLLMASRSNREWLADAQFGLARALWASPRSREHARELARVARTNLGGIKTTGASFVTVADIDAWERDPVALR